MSVILTLLILSATPGASIGERLPEAVEIFHCTFDDAKDVDFDRWPEGWTRRLGPAFPHFVKIGIGDLPAPGGRAMEIRLDGGAGLAQSPPIPISPHYDFVLECFLQTEGLQHDRAWVSLALLDEERRVVETYHSERVREAGPWRRLRLGPVSPQADRPKWAVVGLHLEPAGQADLKGTARFADLWLGRLPRMSLATNPPRRILDNPAAMTVVCTASGLTPKGTTVGFELLDVDGRRLAQFDQPFRLETPVAAPSPPAAGRASSAPAGPPALVGVARWAPPLAGPGFYRIVATMPAASGLVHRRGLTLAVIQPQRAPPGGEFGWTLPGGSRRLAVPDFAGLIAQAGISRIKYPLWLGKASDAQAREAAGLLDALSSQGVEMVGMLCEPPEEVRGRLDPAKPISAADMFSLAPEVWAPSIEATMIGFGTRVRSWQLGHDRDTSFVGFPDMLEKVARAKAELDRIGRGVSVAIGWNAAHPLLDVSGPARPWRAVCLSAVPPLSDRELPRYLASAQQPGLRRWVVLEPLAEQEYAYGDRAADLVRRMAAARSGAAEAVFLADPFDPQRGILHEDGSPREMFLPWRTAALALAGATWAGSMPLPGRSDNHVFTRGQEAAVILWNERPTSEMVYLGEDARSCDVWGRPVKAGPDAARRVLEVGPLPTVVTGVPAGLARWQADFTLANDRIPSTFDRRHEVRLGLRNGFDQAAEGSVELFPPEDWTIRPQRIRFRLASGEPLSQALEVTPPVNVSSGPHAIRAEFTFAAGRPYRFSAVRNVHVGLGDARIELATRLTPAGELEVQQRFVNQTDQAVSFRCQLFAPERRRLSSQVVGLGRGEDLRVYRFPDGRALIGKTLWLQAEEVDGPRLLNYRFVAEQ